MFREVCEREIAAFFLHSLKCKIPFLKLSRKVFHVALLFSPAKFTPNCAIHGFPSTACNLSVLLHIMISTAFCFSHMQDEQNYLCRNHIRVYSRVPSQPSLLYMCGTQATNTPQCRTVNVSELTTIPCLSAVNFSLYSLHTCH